MIQSAAHATHSGVAVELECAINALRPPRMGRRYAIRDDDDDSGPKATRKCARLQVQAVFTGRSYSELIARAQ